MAQHKGQTPEGSQVFPSGSEDSATRLAVATLIPPLPPASAETPGSGLGSSHPQAVAMTQNTCLHAAETVTQGTDMGREKQMAGLQDQVWRPRGLGKKSRACPHYPGGASLLPMVTGSLTFEFRSPLVTQRAGNPCSEGAALVLWGRCPGSAFFTSHTALAHAYGCTSCLRWLWLVSPSFEGQGAFMCILRTAP